MIHLGLVALAEALVHGVRLRLEGVENGALPCVALTPVGSLQGALLHKKLSKHAAYRLDGGH